MSTSVARKFQRSAPLVTVDTSPVPAEVARLEALASYAVLDTPPEEAFDQLALLATRLCNTPIAVVSFIDSERQWFKAVVGLPLRETERAIALCAHVLAQGSGPMVVPDALQDPRFCTNPLVLGAPHIRFYACIPLTTAEGFVLGTLAVVDTQARTMEAAQLESLRMLAGQTMALLALRQKSSTLAQLAQERAHMQAVLQAQTHTLRVAGHIARVGGWVVELSDLRMEWSQDLALPFMQSQQVQTAEQALALLAPEHRASVRRAFRACMRNGRDFDLTVPFPIPDGSPVWVRAVGQAVRNAQGQVVRVQGAFQDVTESHDRDTALRLSEERFLLATRATADAVWDWNLHTDEIWWSEGVHKLFGRPSGGLFSATDTWVVHIHPDEREAVLRSLQACFDSLDTHWSAEYRFQCTDGRYLWVQDRGFVIRAADGQAVRMVGGMTDTSALKQADLLVQHEAQTHAALVRVQQRMSSMALDLAQVLGLVADAALHATDAHGALVALLQGDRLDIQAAAGVLDASLGTRFAAAGSPLWTALCQEPVVLHNAAHSVSWNLPAIDQTPGLGSLLATPLRANGAVVGFILVVSTKPGAFGARDTAHLQILSESLGSMVQLRAVAAQLQASEKQYKLLFDAHPQPMWVYALDENHRILAVNQAMLAMYGYSEAELLQMDMHQLLPPTAFPHNTAPGAVLLPSDGVVRRHRRKNGTVIDVEVSERPIQFNARRACQTMVIDVTVRLRAERELARVGRAQHLLSTCNETLVRATSEADLLHAICRITVDIGGYRMAWVGLARDDEHKSIEPVAHAGPNGHYLETLDLSWSESDPRGAGPAGTAVRSGQAVIVHDVQSDTLYGGWNAHMQAHGFRGVVCLPLRHADRIFGLLQLYSAEVLQVSPEETHLLQDLANDLAFGIMSLRARQEQQRLQASVLKVAAAVSATTGTEFFVQLARNMAEALGAQVGWVGRLLPPTEAHAAPQALSLGVVVEGQLLPNAQHSLEGTPSLLLATQRQYVVTQNAAERYPAAAITQQLQAQSYVGQQLHDNNGVPLGMIFVLFRQPIANADFVSSTLRIFAARASAEIQRQLTDAHIRRQASLLNKARDAIVVRNLDHTIAFWNQGAERAYGWSEEEVLGKSIATTLYDDTTAFLRATAVVLAHGEWTGEIAQKHRDGHALEMEGRWTLVRGDDGQPESILAINTDIGQRKATEREIQRLAFYDVLTGLPNRMLLMDRMHQALISAQRSECGGALLFIDLDNFKTLNDTLGHDKGDLLLQQVAQRLNTCVRSIDTVARLGGDEFVVMLEDLSADREELALQARSVGEKILACLATPYNLDSYRYRSTPSIGIAPFLGNRENVGELLKQADLAMYQAKTAGRNTLRFFDPNMQAVVTARAALEADLRTALAENQFVLHYQPQVDAQGHYVGVEALVRWRHPQRGMVPPLEFIALAEETGLILTLGRWVLHTACELLAQWRKDPLLRHLSMAVNVSSCQFRHANFVNDVVRVLAVTGAPSSLLKLELTESLLVQDMDATIATMAALRAYSVGFSLDDFGTGYSSLSYLKRMPLDQLKIDQSFVRDLLTDPNDAAIVNTIIGLSDSLGLSVIAEGVETVEQRDLLLQAGCLAFQGYFFSRPLPADQLERLLRTPLGL